MKNKKAFFVVIIVLLIFTSMYSGYKIITYHLNMKKDAAAFEALTQITQDNTLSARYNELYRQNNDFFGWIRIVGTQVDYPVMHTPDEPEFYLRRSFDKAYSASGTPFLSADCYEGCGNYIIYGHNMKNGSMFASLAEYSDKKYHELHKIIQFDTISEEAEYEVLSAFRTSAAQSQKSDLLYWEYADLTDKERFDKYINYVKTKSLYDTKLSAEFGDELLTLSTCDYHETDGRFVVVAKKIK